MDKNKSQIIFLDKSGVESVAKALSSACWTITNDNNNHGDIIDGNNISESVPVQCVTDSNTVSVTSGYSPQLTFAQGNVRPVTQVSGNGGSGNKGNGSSSSSSSSSSRCKGVERTAVFKRDNTQVATLAELGKKLVSAARDGNTSQVRSLMAVGAPFTSDGPIGMTAIHLASQNGHFSTCDRLLCAGMNKDSKNKVDKTPLHLAATEGHLNIAALLVKNGANINACDMLKMTALHWACDRGHISIVELLLKHDAKTNLKNKFSKTPLQLAIENGHKDIVTLLKGGIIVKEENLHDNIDSIDEEEEIDCVIEENICVESLDNNIPSVEKIEEVHTHQMFVHQMCDDNQEINEDSKTFKEEDDIENDNEDVHSSIQDVHSSIQDVHTSILTDDLEDDNISVLATLAELAHTTHTTSHHNTVEMSKVAALELLKAQAALLDEPNTLVTSAIAHGQTLHLTEAGRQALKIINKEIPLIPTTNNSSLPKQPPLQQEEEEEEHKIIPKTEDNNTSQSPAIHLPALLPPDNGHNDGDNDDEEEEQVTQVITLTPEQYAALTGSTNGPILLQVVREGEDENKDEDNTTVISQPDAKRQKIMQLVTRMAPQTKHSHPVAKVNGQVLNVEVPVPGVSNM